MRAALPGRAAGSERGSSSVELVMLAPVMVGFIFAIVGANRWVTAQEQVSAASFASARAATLTTDNDAAAGQGRQAAEAMLADRGRSCARLDVHVDSADFQPGGSVRVTVTCTADLSDVVGFGLPGHHTFTHSATVPIETHRVM